MKRIEPEGSAKFGLTGFADMEIKRVKESLVNYSNALDIRTCTGCNKALNFSPTFLCCDCNNQPFCIWCFMVGTATHSSKHSYYVLDRLKFPLYSPNWTAKEELLLMKSIEMFGVDNWPQIAETIETKTADECEAHYYTFYYKSAHDKVPSEQDLIIEKNGKIVVNGEKAEKAERKERHYLETKPEIFNDKKVEKEISKNPPKYGIEIQGADNALGYMPLRGDFNIEYDNDAEKLLADIEFFDDDSSVDIRTKEDILELYNKRLDERIRRKEFVIRHGLLDAKKPLKGENDKMKEEKEMFMLMRPFMRFCEGDEYNELVEGLIKERSLRKELDEERLYRALGLQNRGEIDRYLEKRQTKGTEQMSQQKKSGRKKGRNSVKEGSMNANN